METKLPTHSHLEEALQGEIYRLWHEVGHPDTDGWQAWPKALAIVLCASCCGKKE